jgi:uroporphyrinogen-III decarboxylase
MVEPMNSKERMLSVLAGQRVAQVPVAPHWWGNYKFEIAGKDYMLDCWTDGPGMVPVYQAFFERFRPDWLHISGGYPRLRRGIPSSEYRGIRVDERMFLVAPDGSRDEILADGNLKSSKRDERDLSTPKAIRRAIDEDLDHFQVTTADDIMVAGYTDHAVDLVQNYGELVFICVNVGAPGMLAFGSERYEESLMALYDYPEGVKRLVWQRYKGALELAKAFARVGVHGWLISEDMAGADTFSPRMYQEILYPANCWFFEQVSQLGLVPMVYFCGDIRPLVSLIRDSGVRGLLIEENRKTFAFDLVQIVKELRDKVCLFGNIDTTDLLLRGRPSEVQQAVRKQLEYAEYGPFVISNGSPLAPGTPPENIHAMVDAARAFGRFK